MMNRLFYFIFFISPSVFSCTICEPLKFPVTPQAITVYAEGNPVLLDAIASATESALSSGYSSSVSSGSFLLDDIVLETEAQLARGAITVGSSTADMVSAASAMRAAQTSRLMQILLAESVAVLGSRAALAAMLFLTPEDTQQQYMDIVDVDDYTQETYMSPQRLAYEAEVSNGGYITAVPLTEEDFERRRNQASAIAGEIVISGGITYGIWYSGSVMDPSHMTASGPDRDALCASFMSHEVSAFSLNGYSLLSAHSSGCQLTFSKPDPEGFEDIITHTAAAIQVLDFVSNCPSGTKFDKFGSGDTYFCGPDYSLDTFEPAYQQIGSSVLHRPFFELSPDREFIRFPGRPVSSSISQVSSTVLSSVRNGVQGGTVVIGIEALDDSIAVSTVIDGLHYIQPEIAADSISLTVKTVRYYDSTGSVTDAEISYSTSSGLELNPQTAKMVDTAFLPFPTSGSTIVDQYKMPNIRELYDIGGASSDSTPSDLTDIFNHPLQPGDTSEPPKLVPDSLLPPDFIETLSGSDVFNDDRPACPPMVFDFSALSRDYVDVYSLPGSEGGVVHIDEYCKILNPYEDFLRYFFIFGFALVALWIVLES